MGTQYWLRREGELHGPYSGGRLKVLAASGHVQQDDQISADKQSWQVAGTVRGLFPPETRPLQTESAAETFSGHREEQTPAAELEHWFLPGLPRAIRVAIAIVGVIVAGLVVTAPIWLEELSGEPETSDQLARSDGSRQNGDHKAEDPGSHDAPPAATTRHSADTGKVAATARGKPGDVVNPGTKRRGSKAAVGMEPISFWGFELGASYSTCTRKMRELKQERILSNLSVGTVFAGTMPGSTCVSGDGNVDREGLLRHKPDSITLYFRDGVLKALELRYMSRSVSPRTLFARQVADMERFLKTKGVVRITEDDVGKRTRYAVIDRGKIRVQIEIDLDGVFKDSAPDIYIRSRQVTEAELVEQKNRHLAYARESNQSPLAPEGTRKQETVADDQARRAATLAYWGAVVKLYKGEGYPRVVTNPASAQIAARIAAARVRALPRSQVDKDLLAFGEKVAEFYDQGALIFSRLRDPRYKGSVQEQTDGRAFAKKLFNLAHEAASLSVVLEKRYKTKFPT